MAYNNFMLDVMALLKDRKAKAEAKVVRATKALETAQKELVDVIAAQRVMSEITGESVDSKSNESPVSDRDKEIAKLLAVDISDATSPAELYPEYINATGDSINLDAFRTALWRLQKKIIQGPEKSWAVKSENGKYWREPVPAPDFEEILGGANDDP
jgi:hypothetical protein